METGFFRFLCKLANYILGNRGLSPFPVLDSTCQRQLCIRLSWLDHAQLQQCIHSSLLLLLLPCSLLSLCALISWLELGRSQSFSISSAP